MSHTPGPWTFQKLPDMGPDGETYYYVECGVGAMSHLPGCTTVVDPELGITNEADAILIAAAPDLLDALIEAKQILDVHYSGFGDPGTGSTADKINKAIAKATGAELVL